MYKDQKKQCANVQQDKPGWKESGLEDLMNRPWALNGLYSKTCNECDSRGMLYGEKGRNEQCSRCAKFGYTCRSTVNDDETSAPQACRQEKLPPVDVKSYTQPFLSFISENPTTFHAVATVCDRLGSHGFQNYRSATTGQASSQEVANTTSRETAAV